MLVVEGVEAGYGPLQVLWGVDLRVEGGQIVALIGSNGAGKSSLLRCISGLVPATSGRIMYKGAPTHGLRPHEIVRRGIVQVPEGRRLFPGMTVDENLLMGAYVRKDRGRATVDRQRRVVHELFPPLRDLRHLPAGALSGGQQQMCAIGRALMSGGDLLMLDEPSWGLAPLAVQDVFSALRRIRESGVTILLVEQDVQDALDLADHAYVMEGGQIKLSGPAAQLRADRRISEAYLGI